MDARDWVPILEWILAVSLFPIASIYLILLALFCVLLAFFKAMLLFTIVAINIPFAMMYNISYLALYMGFKRSRRHNAEYYHALGDPRISVGLEVKVMVSDFFKVIAGDLLLVLSAGVITYYTAPLIVFNISMAVGVTAILLKWLNSGCSSKTAFSCLCAVYGLNPLMFFFSFIGLFDMGGHPIASCSFTASKAFLFAKADEGTSYTHFDTGDSPIQDRRIEFAWNAFERGFFRLSPRIDFVKRIGSQYILKTSMVLYVCEREICEYPVDRLELPEDYTKTTELLGFFQTLQDGVVTDKMRGRYEHSLTLQQIVDSVQEYDGYRIVEPQQSTFLVAGYTD